MDDEMSRVRIEGESSQVFGPCDLRVVEYAGRQIVRAEIDDDRLVLTLHDGTKIEVWDDAGFCRERRHMSTDDDVQSLVGRELRRIEAKDGPSEENENGTWHDSCFVEVGTDDGHITLVNHNEHNGYYGGYHLTITELRE